MNKLKKISNETMNRKGFLLGEFTLKVIIAVVCILILGFLIFKLYDSFTSKSDVQNADATLTRVLERANEAIINGKSDYLLLNPNGWILLYSEEGTPQSCQGAKCICLCQAAGVSFDNIKSCTGLQNCQAAFAPSFAQQLAECNSAGACQKLSKNIQLSEMVKIDGPTQVYFLYDSKDSKVIISKNQINPGQ